MNCEVDLCIYNRNFKCLFDETNINALGMCDECIIISLDRSFIEAEKERQLADIEKQWSDSAGK